LWPVVPFLICTRSQLACSAKREAGRYLLLQAIVVKVLVLVFPHQRGFEMSSKLHANSRDSRPTIQLNDSRGGELLAVGVISVVGCAPSSCHMYHHRLLIGGH
jgi:hypothetical protein